MGSDPEILVLYIGVVASHRSANRCFQKPIAGRRFSGVIGMVDSIHLAADDSQQPSRFLHHARETSPLKTRVWGFRQPPSGRFSSRRRRTRAIATGSTRCAYKTASGRRQWPNRDPIGERGGVNLYGFVGNTPINFVDTDGRFPFAVFAIPFIWGAIMAPEYANAPAPGDPTFRLTHEEQLMNGAMAGLGSAATAGLLKGAGALSPSRRLKPCPTTSSPKPPGHGPDWEKGLSSRGNTPGKPPGESYWDPAGGEWHRHTPDPWHSTPHWDYNHWNDWNDAWQNLDDLGNPMP